MIDSIIISGALKNASRLTLPGFGTILKKSDGSFVFSRFLRDDDMYFTSVVMNTYAVGTDEAKTMVSQFIGDINSRLASRGDYAIPEVGRLVRDQSGFIKLVPDFGAPAEPVYQEQQPRQPVMPKPIVGVPQQNMVPPVQNPYYGQPRQQVPYGPGRQPVIPQRRPQQQGPQQRPQMRPPQQQRPQMRPQQQRPQQRPQTNKPAKKDWLLIITIIVALLVLSLMIYSFFVDSVSNLM